jgi:hypothetical protein
MSRFICMMASALVFGLRLVCTQFAVAETIEPSTQPAAAIASVPTPEDLATEKRLDRKLPSVQLPRVTFSDAIDFLRDITGENFYTDWKNLQLAGVTKNTFVSLERQNIPMREALHQILAATGSEALEFHIMGGVVVISTKLDFQDRQHQIGPYLHTLPENVGVAAIMSGHMASVQLPFVPLSDAIDFLRDISQTSILVKWDVLHVAGINKSTPVTLQLQDAPLATILNVLLDQVAEGKLGYTAEPIQVQRRDRHHNLVNIDTVLITISTIDDLKASVKPASTRRS